MLKKTILLLLILGSLTVSAQKNNVKYITAIDSTELNHYLTFDNEGNVTINYPFSGGIYWESVMSKPKTFQYRIHNDTLQIEKTQSISPNNKTEERLLNSNFIVIDKNQLYDTKSNYTYFSAKKSKKYRNGLIAYNNKIYVIKRKGSRKVKRLMNNTSSDDFKITIIRGKDAVEEYGIKGVYGVVKIKKNESITGYNN